LYASPSSYLVRHWRGQLPLATTIGFNVVLATTALTGLREPAGQLGAELVYSFGITGLIVYCAIAGTVFAGIPAWLLTGLWRAAERHMREVGTIIAGRAAQALATMLTIVLAIQFAGVAAKLAVGARIALETSISGAVLETHAGGREIELRGALGKSIVDGLEERIKAPGSVRRLRLNSASGSVEAARRLRSLIVRYRLNTYSTETCAGACSLAYLAGQHRSLRADARLGLWLPPAAGGRQAAEREFLHDSGLAGWLMREWRRRGDRIWYPGTPVLKAGGVVDTFLGGNSRR